MPVRKMRTNIGCALSQRGPNLDIKGRILERMRSRAPFAVWTPVDFLALGPRAAVDKALQRLVRSNQIRRIERGLYDYPELSRLTGKPTNPDYTAVIDAVARRDQIRVLLDGLTAANQLGLADAVPARVIVHTDARIRPVTLGNLTITFRVTAPSRLYWSGRPAMRVVQALYWLRDLSAGDHRRILTRLSKVLTHPVHGDPIRQDLAAGVHTLPTWMQKLVRELLTRISTNLPTDRRAERE